MPRLVSPLGSVVNVPEAKAERLIRQGFTPYQRAEAPEASEAKPKPAPRKRASAKKKD